MTAYLFRAFDMCELLNRHGCNIQDTNWQKLSINLTESFPEYWLRHSRSPRGSMPWHCGGWRPLLSILRWSSQARRMLSAFLRMNWLITITTRSQNVSPKSFIVRSDQSKESQHMFSRTAILFHCGWWAPCWIVQKDKELWTNQLQSIDN